MEPVPLTDTGNYACKGPCSPSSFWDAGAFHKIKDKRSQAQNVFSEHNFLSFVCACLHLKCFGAGRWGMLVVCGALSHPVKSPWGEHVAKPQAQIFRPRMLPSGPLRADYCLPRSCSNFRFLGEERKSDRIMWWRRKQSHPSRLQGGCRH